MKLFRIFKINGKKHKFKYLNWSKKKEMLKPFIESIKLQSHRYRITKEHDVFVIWMANE